MSTVVLRKGNKSGLIKRLGVLEMTPDNQDMFIVDVSQLFYHIAWPFGGNPSNLIEPIKDCLNHYPYESKKVIVFDKYEAQLRKYRGLFKVKS